MKKLKQWKGLDHKASVLLMLLSSLFLEVVVTKVVILLRPEMDPWRNASDINKIFIPVLALLLILLYLKTPLEIRWPALKIPDRKKFGREMLTAACISAALILVMAGIRLWMNARSPEAAARPLFGLYLGVHGRWFYPASSVLQEFMIKAFVQENIRRLNATSSRHLTVLLTGLFFAALHMNYPLYYLISAGLLCLLTGYLYERNENIWGSALIHFTLGFMPRALGLY